MKYQKIIGEIQGVEKKCYDLNESLKSCQIFQTKNQNYTQADKQEFLLLWNQYIDVFFELIKLLEVLQYRKFIFFKNYSRLVLYRYVLHIYFYVLHEILTIFGGHERFLRELMKESTPYHYGYFALIFYQPKNINIYNIASIFLQLYAKILDSSVIPYISVDRFMQNPLLRTKTDSTNLYFYCKNKADKIIFKCMKIIGNAIAHIRFSRRNEGLITQENLQKYLDQALPGDILLTRGNWNATNISIPGFWKHMSMYMGSGKYLQDNFACEGLDDNKHYIIEATSLGVILKPIQELTKNNDYLGVIRSTFSQEKLSRVLQYALDQRGKGYDYIFNFYSNQSLVCSELVLKSYAKDYKNDEGFSIKLEHIGMGVTFPPNNIMKILNRQCKKKYPKLLPFYFIDSIEKTHKNFVSSHRKFLISGDRSRFSFFLK